MLITKLGSCLLILCSWQIALAEEAPLLWKFEVGDVHHYQMAQDMEMNISMAADNEVKTNTKQVIDMTWNVDAIDDQGVATITQQITRARMDMQAPGQQELHLDTDSDETPKGFAAMLAPLYKAMTSESFKLKMTPHGEIQDVEIPESMTKAMKKIPGASMMGGMFSEEGLKNMAQKCSLVLPNPEELKIGHEWTTSMEIDNPMFGKLETKSIYRYLGPKDVAGKIFESFGYELDMSFGDGTETMPVDVTSQESNGELLFNREAGNLQSSKLTQNMEMSFSTAGQNVTQKLVQNMTFERVEKED